MPTDFQIIDPTARSDWDKLVLDSPGHSVFHSSCWAKVLRDSYGYRPCYLAAVDGGRFSELVPLMEIRSFLTGTKGVSLPFTDFCEPILSDSSRSSQIETHLAELGKKAGWKYVELRGGTASGQVPYARYYRHDLVLSGSIDALYQNLKGSIRRNIRKAEREGVTIRQSSELEAIRTYYDLHCLTRKKHGLPPQPIKFFLNLYRSLIEPGRGQIILARQGGKTIAAAVFLHFGNEAVYKYGASDVAYLHLRPNDLLMWEAIRDYAGRGYRRFSFGRTDMDDSGLLQFKRGWGGEERTITYHRYDLRENAFIPAPAGPRRLSPGIFRSLPVPALRLAGSLLYRHMG